MCAAPLLALLLLSAEEPSSSGDPSALDKQRQEEVALLAPAKARLLALRVGDEEGAKGALHEEPLLRWSNPTVGSVYGEVFVWHTGGRPAAIASIFRWYHPFKDGTVEIVSLSSSPVQAREGEQVLWDCRQPGVSFQSLSGGSAPAKGRGTRLAQMREIVRRFSVELADTRGGESVTRQLRLLDQPLYRYESTRHDVLDGALFAFAEVTDPEVIVMIEAAKGDDRPFWRYALARMNNHEIHARLGDREVQSWPRIDQPWKDRQSSYTLFSFDPQAVNVEKKPEQP